MRIHEIAKIINSDMKSKDIVDYLASQGIKSTSSSTATTEMIDLIKKKYNFSGELTDGVKDSDEKQGVKPKIKSVSSGKKPKSAPAFILIKKEKKEPVVIQQPSVTVPLKTEEKKIIEENKAKIENKQEILKEPAVTVQQEQTVTADHVKFFEQPTPPPVQISSDKSDKEYTVTEKHEEIDTEQSSKKPSSEPQPADEKNKSMIKQRIFSKNGKQIFQPKPYSPQQPKPAAAGTDIKSKQVLPLKPEEIEKSKFVEKQEEKLIDKKKFVKKDLQQITQAIQSISKRKNKKKSKLLKMLKKKKIAERLADEQAQEIKSERYIKITDPTTIQDLSQKSGKSVNDIIKFLISNGMLVTVNQKIDADTAEMIAAEFGFGVEIEKLYGDIEEEKSSVEPQQAENNVTRAPVVTIMGHVDHGKTTLLDEIRKSKIVDTETGGITQHIGAYKIVYKDKPIVFLDTPGHKAFSSMRSRGANITDIVVLVVAADDGLMPQTIEAINHTRAAKAPIIIAINKIDKPNINLDKIKQQLAERDLLVESWGGSTLSCEISALTGTGIDNLLETILLQTEMMELKCNPDIKASGAVVEASLDKGLGPTMTVLIQNGTLHTGDSFVAGVYSGKVRVMYDDKNQKIESAGPSTPVKIIGGENVPEAGDPFNSVDDEKTAREISVKRTIIKKESEDKKIKRLSLESLFSEISKKDINTFNIILKADVRGSVEAIHSSLKEIGNEKLKVNIIQEGVGAITESDVTLASASDAIIIGFKVRPESIASSLAKKENIEIRLYDIIYNLLDDVKAAMTGMLESVIEETVTGKALVKEVFKISKLGKIAGSVVIEGKILFPSYAKLIRDNIMLYNSKLFSLKHYKTEVREVVSGKDCGIGLENYEDIKEGDIIECYIKTEKKQVL